MDYMQKTVGKFGDNGALITPSIRYFLPGNVPAGDYDFSLVVENTREGKRVHAAIIKYVMSKQSFRFSARRMR